MAKIVQYKKPRRFNVVTVILILLGIAAGWAGVTYFPVFMLRSEVYRILEEKSSEFAASRRRFLAVQEERRALDQRMRTAIMTVGVRDPEFETWIEPHDDGRVVFGCAYMEEIHYPFDIVEPTQRVYQAEFVLDLSLDPQ
jgi:hypothetical protein